MIPHKLNEFYTQSTYLILITQIIVDVSSYQTPNILNSIKTRKTIMKILLALSCFCHAPFKPNFKMSGTNCHIWK